MSDNALNPQQNEDEIDLLDLLVVLIKYRVMIIASCLGILIVAGAGYFFYPPWQYKKSMEEQLVEANLSLSAGTALLAIDLQYDLGSIFSSAPLLLSALKEAGYEKFKDVDITEPDNDIQALNTVRQFLIRNQDLTGKGLPADAILFHVNDRSTFVELSYRSSDPEKAIAFLKALHEKADSRLLVALKPQLETVVDGYERLLFVKNPSDGLKQAITDGQQHYDAAKKVLEENAPALVIREKPYIIKSEISIDTFKSSYKKKAVILVFAVFFLSIFLAFVLNAIDSVKKDEKAMAKINKALGKDSK